ncbi:MAG: hypothetical protein AAF235_09160 [Planctomycetota bacterium]
MSLIEAVVVVVMLSISVPPSLGLMGDIAANRADAINAARAAALGGAVLETVLADVASGDGLLGFAALGGAATYLDAPGAGLYARLAGVAAPYASAGLTYTVEIGSLVDTNISVNANAALNRYRVVTVRVSFVGARGNAVVAPFSVLTGDLG